MPLPVTEERKSSQLHSGPPRPFPVTVGFSVLPAAIYKMSPHHSRPRSRFAPHRGVLFGARFLLIDFPRKKQSHRAGETTLTSRQIGRW